jgi:hypothetical protein
MSLLLQRRSLLTLVSLLAAGAVPALAQQVFRIGTGSPAGTYYPVGQLIAHALSQPGRLMLRAEVSNGSVANVNAIAEGELESGFSQSDVATWAQRGTGIFEGKTPVPALRLIATLYPESVHVVVRKGAGIASVAQLRGKRVALDEPGSGTLVNARAILLAHGLREGDVQPVYIKPIQAAEALKDDKIDAFFYTGGAPGVAIAQLASSTGIDILPIEGPPAQLLRAHSPFFSNDVIPAGTYKGVAEVHTLAVGAQWVTSEKADANLVYEITRALFSEAAQQRLSAGHPKGRFITKENAIKGAGIPFHPGALRFYREAGLLR